MAALAKVRTVATFTAVALSGMPAACAQPSAPGRNPEPATAVQVPESQSREFADVTGARVLLSPAPCSINVQGSGAAWRITLDVPLPAPCRFVTDGTGAQVVGTPHGDVILIASSAPVAGSRFCDTRVMAVVVKAGTARLSAKEQKIGSCDHGPFDTKMFFVLAAP